MNLSDVNIDSTVKITDLSDLSEFHRQRLIELGFVRGAEITPVLSGIFNGIRAYRVKSTTVAIRNVTAECIKVSHI